MNIEAIIDSLKNGILTSETEVRTKVVIPMLEALGYESRFRAEEFPVYGNDGRRDLNTKFADIILFDSPEFHDFRKRIDRFWVQRHSLVVVEIKKPSESIAVEGQAEFYALWTRAPFFVIVNGVSLSIYRVSGLFDSRLELSCSISDLKSNWHNLEALLSPDSVRHYLIKNKFRPASVDNFDYSGYVESVYLRLCGEDECVLPRTVAQQSHRTAFPFRLSKRESEPETDRPLTCRELIASGDSYVIEGGPGSGKTTLVNQLALDLIRLNGNAFVPVIVLAKQWGRNVNSIEAAIKRDVGSYTLGVTESIVEQDLRAGRFLIFVDGLDEVESDLDRLFAEIGRIKCSTNTRFICTSRTGFYQGQLQTHLTKCVLQSLTGEQVQEFIDESIGRNAALLYRSLSVSLKDLMRTPLFLVMGVNIFQQGSNPRIPRNRAQLYREYSSLVLTTWPAQKALSKPPVVDKATKERILAAYAHKKFRAAPSERMFNDCIVEHKGFWDAVSVRDELKRCGLLTFNADGPEFIHLSFEEYFFAVSLIFCGGAQLVALVSEKGSDFRYREIFGYCVGVNQDKDLKNSFLDAIERESISLMRFCLDICKDDPVPGDHIVSAEEFLTQLLSSYEALIECHFADVRRLIDPWRSTPKARTRPDLNLTIRGSLERGFPGVDFEFRCTSSRSIAKVQVVNQADESSDVMVAGTRYFMSLDQGISLDVARDVAFRRLKDDIVQIIRDKMLFECESSSMLAERIDASVRELQRHIRFFPERYPPELQQLDPALSTYELEQIFSKYSHIQILGSGRLSAHRQAIFSYCLGRFTEVSSSHHEFLLPKEDVDVFASGNRDSCHVNECWSDSQAIRLLEEFYHEYQQSYRCLVERGFSALKSKLGFYAAGPMKALITMHRSQTDPQDAIVREMWVPVSTLERAQPEVNLVENVYSTRESDREKYKENSRLFRELGRNARYSPGISWRGFDNYIRDGNLLQRRVYETLKADLERDLGNF